MVAETVVSTRLTTALVAILCVAAFGRADDSTMPVEAERDAAAAIKRLGGWFELDDSGHVVEVNMVYHAPPGGKRIENTDLSDEALQFVPQFTKLEQLILARTQASDNALRFLAKTKSLRKLYLFDAQTVSDDGILHLAGLDSLAYLHINGSQIGDESLRVLGWLPCLEECVVPQSHFTDDGLRHLARATQLKSLWIGLGETHITDAGTAHLRALMNLEVLDLQGCRLTDKGLQPLLELKNLKKLVLDSGADNQITDDGLRQIAANLGKLESLSLQSSNLSEAGMLHLASLTRLEHLGLSGFAIADQGLEPLLGLERLQFLSLTQSQNAISDSGLLKIGDRLRDLEVLWIRGNNITDAGVDALYDLPRLQNVSVKSPHVTTEALLRFKAARPKVTAYFYK